jgi:hypothetical protein
MGKEDQREHNRIRTERCLNNTDLRRRGVEASESAPVIDDQTGTNNVGTTIDSTSLVAKIINNAIAEEGERTERTTRGTCNKLESSSWSWTEVFGWTRPP